MQTLTNYQFKNYLASLETVSSVDGVCLNDEYGGVCVYDKNKSTYNFNLALIDRVEYELTEKQKDQLAEVAYLEYEFYK